MIAEEIFDVVDAHDRVIGTAARSEVHARGLRHRAAHVLVFDPRGRLFVQRRSPAKDRAPGLWDTSAAGHLASGEGYLAAGVRELSEELGVVAEGALVPLFKLPAGAATDFEFAWVFRAMVSTPLRPDPAEISDGRWCDPETLAAWIERAPGAFTGSFRLIWRKLRAARKTG